MIMRQCVGLLKIDPSGEYLTGVVYVKSFESTFKLAGGVNLPKIITCLGSDGVTRRQLVKVVTVKLTALLI